MLQRKNPWCTPQKKPWDTCDHRCQGREVQSLKSQLSLAQNYVLKVTGKPIPREVLLGDFTKARANFRGDTWRKLEEFFNVFLALLNSDELFTKSSLIMFDAVWVLRRSTPLLTTSSTAVRWNCGVSPQQMGTTWTCALRRTWTLLGQDMHWYLGMTLASHW